MHSRNFTCAREYSTSNSNPDLYAEFRRRSGPHVKTVERYGCPIDNSENVSFVECFSFEEIPNSLEEVERSQSKDKSLEAMIKEFNSLVDNKTWQLCELPAHKKSLGGVGSSHWKKMRTVKLSSIKLVMLRKILINFSAVTIWKPSLPRLNCHQFVCV